MVHDQATGAAGERGDAAGNGATAAEAAVRRALEDELAQAGVSPRSPEARRLEAKAHGGLVRRGYARVAPGTRPFTILKRVLVGTYFDGFIHAGNLAYLSLIALFPFFITATALLSALGQGPDGVHALERLLDQLPPAVAQTLDGPVHEVLAARTGPLLWLGALVGLWTVGSLIETIRDILRRAYGTQYSRSFWHYRLLSIGIIVGSVLLLMLSVSLGVVAIGLEQLVSRLLPDRLDALGELALSRGISIAGLYLSLYLLFYSLTPSRYRVRRYPKWPGALTTTLWAVGVTAALPPLLASVLSYDLTYGSMAGVMIVLFFFYLIGLGVVIGAELNAALAESPEEEQDRIGQGDNRGRAPAAGKESA